jgi:multiple sugar transport system ATP-binding protein
VGRAIVRKPSVFLFDEPLSNLDAKLRVQMRIEITKLHRRLQATMVYVTHDQVEAMTMGDRIVVMKDGIVQQVDTPLNLYQNPANIFVAGFICSPSMNFAKGTLMKNKNLEFHCKDFKLAFDKISSKELKISEKKDIILGIRPEHLSIRQEAENHWPEVPVEVEVIEPMGNESYMYGRAGDQSFVLRGPLSPEIKVSDVIPVYFNVEKMHFFDPVTEETLI